MLIFFSNLQTEISKCFNFILEQNIQFAHKRRLIVYYLCYFMSINQSNKNILIELINSLHKSYMHHTATYISQNNHIKVATSASKVHYYQLVSFQCISVGTLCKRYVSTILFTSLSTRYPTVTKTSVLLLFSRNIERVLLIFLESSNQRNIPMIKKRKSKLLNFLWNRLYEMDFCVLNSSRGGQGSTRSAHTCPFLQALPKNNSINVDANVEGQNQ